MQVWAWGFCYGLAQFCRGKFNSTCIYSKLSISPCFALANDCVVCENTSHCCDPRPQQTEISSSLKKYFSKNRSLFMSFAWIWSESYNWSICITIWGCKNQCVLHLHVWCYLNYLLLFPVSAWRLPCCSVPASRSLWSSSIKMSSPAEFITAKQRDGYEPTHHLKLHIEVRCKLQVNSHIWWEWWCLIPGSSFLHCFLKSGQNAVTARSV